MASLPSIIGFVSNPFCQTNPTLSFCNSFPHQHMPLFKLGSFRNFHFFQCICPVAVCHAESRPTGSRKTAGLVEASLSSPPLRRSPSRVIARSLRIVRATVDPLPLVGIQLTTYLLLTRPHPNSSFPQIKHRLYLYSIRCSVGFLSPFAFPNAYRAVFPSSVS